jgi:hypothetical protein
MSYAMSSTLSPAQLNAIMQHKREASDGVSSNPPPSSSSSSIAMLSPPLSPYPKLAEIVNAQPIVQQPKAQRPISLAKGTTKVQSKPVVILGVDRGRVTKHDPRAPLLTSWDSLKKDPVTYYAREAAFRDLYPLHGPTWSNYVALEPLPFPALQALRTRGSRAVSSRPGSVRPMSRNRIRRTAYYSDDSDGMITRSASRVENRDETREVSRTPRVETVVRRRAPPSRPATPRSTGGSPAPQSRVHDLALSALTDYSPPVSSLSHSRALRAEWKGAPMDLSNDPNVQQLHPAEVHLASVLRLPADVYLDSKKRLFAEKVHRMRHGLPFRRTDSQKACRIDVNKASRLFSAYERVGWLDDELFKKFL